MGEKYNVVQDTVSRGPIGTVGKWVADDARGIRRAVGRSIQGWRKIFGGIGRFLGLGRSKPDQPPVSDVNPDYRPEPGGTDHDENRSS